MPYFNRRQWEWVKEIFTEQCCVTFKIFQELATSPKSAYPERFVYGPMEFYHNGVHVFVGGQMDDVPCSPSDPVFFLHHSFIDRIWEDFRQLSQVFTKWFLPCFYHTD